MSKWIAAFLMAASGSCAYAGQVESEDALTRILFEEDMQNISYSLRSDGFVDIVFGTSVTDADYSRVLNKLKSSPDIPGVLAGRGKGDYCPVGK